jgi:FAD/FMN-containing dehydrogenase
VAWWLVIISRWAAGEPSDAHIRWARETRQAMRPFASGVHANYLAQEGEDRVKAAYGAAKYERLVALKNTYDPTNFFRMNQNVKPTASAVV